MQIRPVSYPPPKIPSRETKIKKQEYTSYFCDEKVTPLNLSPSDIEFSENEIKCSTLDKLIEYGTSTDDKDFVYTFILTYQSFSTSLELLEKLISRYFTTRPVLSMEWIKKELIPIRLRVILLIKYWVEKNHEDFDSSNELYNRLDQFIKLIKKTNGEGMASALEKTFIRMKNPGTPLPISREIEYPKTLKPKKNEDVLDWHPKEIARQLTLREFEMFKKIRPKECLNWTKEKKGTSIQEMINWFNALSNYLCFKILESKNVKDRVKVIQIIIQIANECQLLKNYNATFELLSVLNHSSVHRLKATWELLTSKDRLLLDELNHYVSSDGNFKFLREKVGQYPPVLPYIGLYLTDITFCEDGNANLLNGKINFGKRLKMASIIKDIQRLQVSPFVLLPDAIAQTLLSKLTRRLTDEELYDLSLNREKR